MKTCATTRVDAWLKQVGLKPDQTPRIVKQAPTIVGVWENYKVYLSRSQEPVGLAPRDAVAVHLRRSRNPQRRLGAGSPGLRDRRAVFRDIGTQAWYDYLGWSNPVGVSSRASSSARSS